MEGFVRDFDIKLNAVIKHIKKAKAHADETEFYIEWFTGKVQHLITDLIQESFLTSEQKNEWLKTKEIFLERQRKVQTQIEGSVCSVDCPTVRVT